MSQFNTIHLFGFGDAQIIGKETNGTLKSSTLTTLTEFIDHIKTFKPEDVILSDYHVIHIFNGMDVRYLGKREDSNQDKLDFTIKIADIDTALLTALVEELVAKVEEASEVA